MLRIVYMFITVDVLPKKPFHMQYVCIQLCMYVCIYVRTYVRIYVRMYVCMHACMYVCTYSTYVCMYSTYVCMYVCMSVCMSVMYTDTKFHKPSCNCSSLITTQQETEIISHGGHVVLYILLNCYVQKSCTSFHYLLSLSQFKTQNEVA